MGYFHEGHLDLIRRAREAGDIVVVSIFVNPTQFGPGEDLSRYPRDIRRDSRLAEQEGCDILFVPEASDMYSDDFLTWTPWSDGTTTGDFFIRAVGEYETVMDGMTWGALKSVF